MHTFGHLDRGKKANLNLKDFSDWNRQVLKWKLDTHYRFTHRLCLRIGTQRYKHARCVSLLVKVERSILNRVRLGLDCGPSGEFFLLFTHHGLHGKLSLLCHYSLTLLFSLLFTPHHNWPTYSPDGFLIMASEVGVVAMILYCTSSLKTGLVYFFSAVYMSFLALHNIALLFSNRQGCCSIICYTSSK